MALDDGLESHYVRRLQELEQQRETERALAEDGDTIDTHDEILENGLIVPHRVWSSLFPHQKEGIEWLYSLHEQNAGGILGDDMGLGKTVQIAAYFACLHKMQLLSTTLLACPASVLWQWVRELHKWCPELRVVLLHNSGSSTTSYGTTINKTFKKGGVVLTTYENLRANASHILPNDWDYVVLDEGHRIRNPDAEITLVCKQLRTVHRIILTGSPIQNRLKELWSLFDFVFPGKLGTFPTFEDEFVLPIRYGGYANATKMQIVMAYKCALVLRDLIAPYMLRRMKKDVQIATALPDKMEQVIFCPLTSEQISAYKIFLCSPEVRSVLAKEAMPFRALTILRQICNHPDLVSNSASGSCSHRYDIDLMDEDYGTIERSGKMNVLQTILEVWYRQRHRVLVFAQHRRTLDILCKMMKTLGYTFSRLDGTTSVKERQVMIDAYNAPTSDIFCFLLTTRAGGIGVNLTGADRVIIFDPDWNPSTDMQARERAWRMGQTKPVTIYRLITSGTIEEKIYHRQLFKQYLMNKVLRDPKQKRCFNHNTLNDLFVLSDGSELKVDENGQPMQTTGTETGDLYLHGHIPLKDGEIKENDTDVEVADLQSHLGSKARVERRTRQENNEEEPNANITEEAEEPEEKPKPEDNSDLLKTLFDNAGIKGVFSQDKIESDGIHNQEADLIDMESEKVAKSALSTLRQSCSAIRQQRQDQFEVTWTGKSGSAGNPKRVFGNKTANGVKRPLSNTHAQAAMESQEMLKKIKMRRNAVDEHNKVTSTSYASIDDLTRQLHAFLAKHATHGVPTDVIVSKFSDAVAPKDKTLFRNLLRSMATCVGRVWRLNDDYKT
ncbi:DNA excision repair protein ERCC-6 [Thraustotheca clavata]|uniref:DNA excision repair protein ERCC-6 n=1 Tax=Thraustotheca clavata TaxID=74557 RepID=A0A1V9ZVU1_9STRA|nr:DNA excision repair protein ERCC-6 [Thraustotheca clavata]